MTDPAGPLTRSEAAALLDVAATAPPADVQRAFLRAARRVHPDVLPDASETERHAAALAFDRLLRARDVLLVPTPRAAAAVPSALRAERRGLGGSLVVLALLAFLLVLLVTVEQGARLGPFEDGPSASAPALAP